MPLSVTIQVWTCESMDTRVKIRVYFWIPFLSCGSQGSYLECRVWQPVSSPSEPFWFFSALDPKQPTAISEGQQKGVALVVSRVGLLLPSSASSERISSSSLG